LRPDLFSAKCSEETYRFCNVDLAYTGNLKRHIDQAHNGKHPVRARVLCSICGKAFAGTHNLNRHIRTAHEQRDEDKAIASRKKYSKKLSLPSRDGVTSFESSGVVKGQFN